MTHFKKTAAILMLVSFIFSTVSPAMAEASWQTTGTNVGTNAMKESTANSATGENSVAMGYQTNATGDYSTAMGHRTTARGDNSTTMGWSTNASGQFSTAMGMVTNASGEASTAMGRGTNAIGHWSTSMGSYTTAKGYSSTAMGVGTTAYENSSTAMGRGTTARGDSSTSMGTYTTASGQSSTAMGGYTNASGSCSTAMGYYTNASGKYSMSMGYNTNAAGISSFAGGGYYTSSLDNAAGGQAYGRSSIAFGEEAVAGISGDEITYTGTIALGNNAKSVTANSVALGNNAVTKTATNVTSVTLGGKTYTFTGGNSPEGVVAIGDAVNNTNLKQLKGVANGAIASGSTDAVNGGQIFDILDNFSGGGSSSNAVEYDDTAKTTVTFGDGTNSTTLTHVKAGDLSAASTDAVNGGQLYTELAKKQDSLTTAQLVAANSGITAAKVTAYEAYDGRITAVETTVNNITSGHGVINTTSVTTDKVIVKNGSGTQTTVIDEGGIKTNSVTVGDSSSNTVINESGVTTNNANVSNNLTVGGKVNITETGINMGDTQITNIANGVTSATPLSASNKNAINGADLYNEVRNGAAGNYIAETNTTAQNLKNLDDAIGKIDDGIVYKALNPDDSVAKNLEALDDAIKNIEVGNVETIAGNKTSSSEKAAKATGANSVAIGYNTEVSGKEAIGAGYGNKVTGDYSTAVGYKNEISGNNSGAFGDPNIISGNESYAVGNNNEIAGHNNFVLGNNVKIASTVENSVALGDNSTVTESNVISVGSTDNKRRIVNVADGINPTDAATVGQLNSVAGQIENAIAPAVQNMQNQLGTVSNEMREVGAISAALAGLHYVEPSGEEGDKLVGAVAYGGYRGANAEAIGIAYKPNPNMMLSASTSISNGNDSQNAYNVGFSLKFGKGETAQTRTELKKQVKFVNEQNIALKDTVAQQGDTIAQQGAEIQTLKNDNEAIRKENAEIKEMLKKLIKK